MNTAPIEELLCRLPALEPLRGPLYAALRLLIDGFASGGKLLLCGNGGSACDSQHIAGELMKGFQSKRPLTAQERAALQEYGAEGAALAQKLQRALPCVVLSGLEGLSTAFLNDVDGGMIYAQQAFAYARPGDVLLGISTSGNAQNVRLAAIAAKARGAAVLGLTGASGGALRPLCDVCLCAPETETYRVQELHLPIYHALCLCLEKEFFADS